MNMVCMTTGSAKSFMDNSYSCAVNHHAQLDDTLLADDSNMDTTLTSACQPKLPTDLPPPPQFGNDIVTSTPEKPPPYMVAVNRGSQLAHSLNTNNSNSLDSAGQPPISAASTSYTTIAGNLPGSRLSLAHRQPMILDDGAGQPVSERSTPSPTTHHLVMGPDEHTSSDDSEFGHNHSPYSFYEQQYKSASLNRKRQLKNLESIRVTFV